MMALEEKFEIQLDEEGELRGGGERRPSVVPRRGLLRGRALCSAGTCVCTPVVMDASARGRAALWPCGAPPHVDLRCPHAPTCACAGAEKISTVQEAADLIAAQVAGK